MKSAEYNSMQQGLSHRENSNRLVLAVIPARGGSKGVLRKNIRFMGGQPLIGYSIQVALAACGIDKVLVSTEDEEIAEISQGLGADVPFLRPKELAGDTSLIEETISYCRCKLAEEGEYYDSVVTLYPTHPFRTVELLEHLVSLLRLGNARVYTAKRVMQEHGFFYSSNSRMKPLLDNGIVANGQQYLRKIGLFFGRNYAVYNKRHKQYVHIVEDPISCIDIDTERDLAVADYIARHNLFDFQL